MDRILNKLGKTLGRFAVPHVTLLIVLGQVGVYLMINGEMIDPARITLHPASVMQGEVWRLVTFIFMPPPTNAIFIFFALYIFYLMGTALERHWGAARYNLYLLLAWAATVIFSFAAPGSAGTNAFIAGSVFLAFAHLFPDFVLHLFFVLPVRIKWLALVTWAYYVMNLVTGPGMARAMVLASTANYFLFFGRDILLKARAGKRHMATQATRVIVEATPIHVCAVCGVTDRTDAEMEFRYCTDCSPARCLCAGHVEKHEHVKVNPPSLR